MADLISHIDQANHNEACAKFLINHSPQYRDWAITAAFYAAVHLAKASFTTRKDIGHSDTAGDKRPDETIHSYRERKIQELARGAHRSYKKLREASEYARYLTRVAASPTDQDHQKMMAYYPLSAVRRFVEEDLPTVRQELSREFRVNLN